MLFGGSVFAPVPEAPVAAEAEEDPADAVEDAPALAADAAVADVAAAEDAVDPPAGAGAGGCPPTVAAPAIVVPVTRVTIFPCGSINILVGKPWIP